MLNTRLQTSDFRLQTSDFRLQTSDFRLQTPDSSLTSPVSSLKSHASHLMSHVSHHSSLITRYSLLSCLLSCVLCLILAQPVYADDSVDVQILETLPDGLVVQFQMPELGIDKKEVEGQVFQTVSFKGCAFTHEIGKAQIPIRVVSLGIPEISAPYIYVLDAKPELMTGYRLYPVEKPLARQQNTLDPVNDEYPDLPSYVLESEFAMDQAFYRQNRFYPSTLAKIEPMGYLRQQRLARLEFFPIQYNPATSELKIYKKLTVGIKFSAVDGSAQQPGAGVYHEEGVFEDLYRDTILNYEQARLWRKPRSVETRRMAPSPGFETSYKLTIEKTGMYRLSYNYLRIAGVDVSSIDPRKIEIKSAGEAIPIYVEGYEDGSFDPGDFIEFYAVKMDSLYTDTNVYWLSWSSLGAPGGKSWMMVTKNGAPDTPGLKPPVAFLDTEHWQQNNIYDPLKRVTSETADHFFWSAMRGGDPRNDRIMPFQINLPYRAYGINAPYNLRVAFQGVTYQRGASDHIVQISFNKETVIAEWQDQVEFISETKLNQVDLDRYNWISMTCSDNNGTSGDTDPKWDVYLDWVEIDYWREFRTNQNRLEFSTETVPPVTKTVQYSVDGFTTQDIQIFQIGKSGAIAKIVNPKIEKGDAFYRVVFEDNVSQPTRYFAATTSSMLRPSSIVKDEPSTLHDPANRIDHIMITHRDFKEATERLADFRRKQGLSVMVVDVDDIYDEFSHGVFDPTAIKRFLRYAYFNWDKIPTYVLLMGDAHWDYKYVYHKFYVKYQNYPRIYVPTYHAFSSPYGQTAMDHRFVTVSGDDILPDIFIGRIPAETPEEADDAVDKIIEYENGTYRGSWQSRVLLIADDEKSKSGDEVFEDSRIELAQGYIPLGYDVVDVYLRKIGEPYIARKKINMEINKGAIVLEYAGHGGAHSWADEYIFACDDVERLQNYGKYPFVITTTCQNGYFDNPTGGNKSIMELFLLKPRAGAVACLSATRLTYGQGNATFDKILYPKIFSERPPILGKIVNETKIDFINLGIATWVPSAEQYTIFGDPATRLALPELDIECELTRSSVDSSKQLELMPGAIKRLKLDQLTGEEKWVTDTGFNAQMQVSVIYPNNLDEDRSNDLAVETSQVKVWRGAFDKVLLKIPSGVVPGEGRLRCYASSGSLSAIGGVRFSVLKPVIEFYSNRFTDDEESLQVHAAIVDNLGQMGIRAVECIWHNTETWKWQTYTMVPGSAPPHAPKVEGLWYVIQNDIRLSRPGTSIEYRIRVVDTEGNEVVSALKWVKVPIGVNLAISRSAFSAEKGISYSYSQTDRAWLLSAYVENNGGKEVKEPVAVYFFEGNPDRNRDDVVDTDAQVLGGTVIELEQWGPGERVIQSAEVSVRLAEPLFSGFHHVFVWINPKVRSLQGRIEIERTEDADLSDDKGSKLFQINEFAVGKADEVTEARSLDGTLTMTLPPDSVDETVMSITRLEPPESEWKPPDLSRGPVPQYGLGNGAFKIQLSSGATSLRKDAQIDIRFDVTKVRELAKESKGLAGKDESQFSQTEKEWIALACQEEARKLGIYAWQEDIEVWKYVPSSLLMEEDAPLSSSDKVGKFAQEPYVTLPINENRSELALEIDNIIVDEVVTPLGNYVIFFLNSDRYKLYLRREGLTDYESLGYGQVGRVYYRSDLGLRLDIRSREEDFKYGDLHKFDTYQDLDGTIKLQSLRSYNKGDGTAHITIMEADGYREVSHEVGEWAILFTSPRTFEIHSQDGQLVRNEVGFPITGELGREIIIPTIGVKTEVYEGRWEFEFGDKFVFRTLLAGTVRARTNLLNTMTLMHSNDVIPPNVQIWVNGLVPQEGVVIPPRPTISILLSDANGIDVDSFSFLLSVDDRDFYPVPAEDYVFSARSADVSSLTNIPVFYSPILNIGKYRYRIEVMDLNGNRSLGDDGSYPEYTFLVEEQPDLTPPSISVTADGQTLIDGQVFHESPEFSIIMEDDFALDVPTISVSFSYQDETLEPLQENEYTISLSDDSRKAVITYAPHLMNGEYAIQAQAVDTSGNVAYLSSPGPIRFRMDEEVKVNDVMNSPNPFSKTTFFTYSLTQPADEVVIKIYTLRGRLVRTLRDMPGWGYNEKYWDGRDEDGNKLASGVYLYRFIVTEADKKIERIGKLAIVR
jgi:hypothetical protein